MGGSENGTVNAYAWSSGFGTKFSGSPSVGTPRGIAFSRSNAVVGFAGSGGSPSIYAYPWSNSTGFGSKYADPATLPTGTDSYGVDFA